MSCVDEARRSLAEGGPGVAELSGEGTVTGDGFAPSPPGLAAAADLLPTPRAPPTGQAGAARAPQTKAHCRHLQD